jgi:hypothetical protein
MKSCPRSPRSTTSRSSWSADRRPAEADIDEALGNLAENVQNFDTKKGGKAADGDQVVIDFVGKVDGEAFEGGSAEDYPLVLGSNSFIPGFEEQLIGVKKGEEKGVEVTFPEEYGAEHLAGKAVVFDLHRQGGEEARPGRDRRRAGQEVRRRGPRRAEGPDPSGCRPNTPAPRAR